MIRNFARIWTESPKASEWPIASGGGLGLMEAALRGATEAKRGKGVAISLYTSLDYLGHREKASAYQNLKSASTSVFCESPERNISLC